MGKITEIALYWPYGQAAPEDTGVRKGLEHLCFALGQEAAVFVLGCPVHRTPVSPDPVIFVPGGTHAACRLPDKAIWVQDTAAMIQDLTSGCRRLLMRPEKTGVHRENYLQLAHACGAGLGLAYPGFEGGNHLFGQACTLAGYDVLLKLAAHAGQDPATFRYEAEDILRQTWGTPHIIWIGGHPSPSPARLKFPFQPAGSLQPMYHLDLFLLMGGINFLGEQEIWVGQIESCTLLNLSPGDADDIGMLAQRLDAVAAYLQRHPAIQFRVYRMPLPGFVEGGRLKLLPYCNGWAEFMPSRKHLILPDFQAVYVSASRSGFIREMQREVTQCLAQAGVAVSWVNLNFEQADERMGALHCKTLVLNRKY